MRLRSGRSYGGQKTVGSNLDVRFLGDAISNMIPSRKKNSGTNKYLADGPSIGPWDSPLYSRQNIQNRPCFLKWVFRNTCAKSEYDDLFYLDSPNSLIYLDSIYLTPPLKLES